MISFSFEWILYFLFYSKLYISICRFTSYQVPGDLQEPYYEQKSNLWRWSHVVRCRIRTDISRKSHTPVG